MAEEGEPLTEGDQHHSTVNNFTTLRYGPSRLAM